MALTVGSYAWPDRARLVAVVAVVAIVGVNLGGLTRTVAVTRVLLVVTLAALAVVVGAGWSGGDADLGRIDLGDGDVLGVLRAGGFCFFAFAGYARIATLGEEVRRPERVIPRAIVVASVGRAGRCTSSSASPCSPLCRWPTLPPATPRCVWWSTAAAGRSSRR